MQLRSWPLLIVIKIGILVAISGCQPAQQRPDRSTLSAEPTVSPTVSADESSDQVIAVDTRYHEAPMLAEQVAQGQLPPVDERLPLNPRVLPVYDSIGRYGGTWRREYTGLGDRFGPTKLIEERIIEYVMPDSNTILIELNWADRFEANADSTAYTVHIREGLKWSDGVAVTTEDVRFWYEDVLFNEAFFESIPADLIIKEEPIQLEIIDAYTFKLKFADSYPLFPMLVASRTPGAMGLQGTSFILPFHYLKDYHPAYTAAEKLQETAQAYGVETWRDLWGDGPVQSWWLNPDLPVLAAWKIVVPPPADPMVMARNPYYHAVDADGNQLPYIDQIVHHLADDPEVIDVWVVQGLIDLQSRHISTARYDLYVQNESQGNYHVATWKSGNTEALFPNLNTTNRELAELFDKVDFRQALSLAINREEIRAVVYSGLSEARQASPVSGSPQYDPEFEQKWVEYDPDTAGRLLDELGLTERDAAGFRLLPSGNRLAVTISATGSNIMLGLVQRYWEAIGIQVNTEILDRLEYEERAREGDLEIGSWTFDRNVIIPADPGRYLGITTDGPWAPLYAQWYASGGQVGVEPPADHPIRDVWAAWEQAKTAATEEEALAFVQEMITIHKNNVWVIGLSGEITSLYIVSNNIRNFPEKLLHETTIRDIGVAQPAQFYFQEP
ncbi:MAG: ABC transporter substrate-binding protein [Anaerolineales bacterium]|nr:ABC transporter substrate-binding protein [Anaerolineales bacterium]